MKFNKNILAFLFLLFMCYTNNAQSSQNDLLQSVLNQLKITDDEVLHNLITSKILPYDTSKSVVVIPKIAIHETDVFYQFDAYVLVVNNKSGAIIQQFYKPNAWISDAIALSELTIDTAPYQLNSDIRAFGIRVKYEGSGKVNPYSQTVLSLFIPEGKNLICVLENYPVSTFHGEWSMDCEGEWNETESIVIIDKQKTNGFYNLLIKETITHRVNTLVNDDCEESEDIKTQYKKLTFNQTEYQ